LGVIDGGIRHGGLRVGVGCFYPQHGMGIIIRWVVSGFSSWRGGSGLQPAVGAFSGGFDPKFGLPLPATGEGFSGSGR
jgi:hypothetical protein